MQLSDVFNIPNNAGGTSLAKILLVYYLLVASNCTENLMSKQTKEFINESRYAQHVIGLMLMFVLITLFNEQLDVRYAFAYAILGYIWFVFSTKLDIHWNMVIVILLFVGYLLDSSSRVRESEIVNDKNLTEQRKEELLRETSVHRTWLAGCVVVVTIVGTLFYSHKKHEQYGGGYDVFVYFLGR
ncbi:hypothetical protein YASMINEVIRUS_900 [Yasminevirus sp. GU-2018]|uniref:Uncharacterized protein n=1 Tax=Yasminevirus sp. GU-2018 TaxID=2420051 RepID=A0A5K0U930_9VIRU|nr:hypothetical protein YASMINEVIRUS_900 [Yasminevirus sp. GU-2018]